MEEVNKEKVKSNVTGVMVEPKKMIGGVTNKDGKVISAKVKLENIGRPRNTSEIILMIVTNNTDS